MKFSSRTPFGVVALVALIGGWFSTWQQADRASKRHEQQLLYAEQELEGSNLTGMTIASTENAFQWASFRNCGLEKANLKGGGASFQFACFDDADLSHATLIGGGASFQGSTFVRAKLTGATLDGGPGSFQCASFEDAILIGAKLKGSFQASNISGAKFEGADISAIDCDDLTSCYFKSPPTYNSATKFPKGFAPRKQLWRRTE